MSDTDFEFEEFCGNAFLKVDDLEDGERLLTIKEFELAESEYGKGKDGKQLVIVCECGVRLGCNATNSSDLRRIFGKPENAIGKQFYAHVGKARTGQTVVRFRDVAESVSSETAPF